MIKEFVFVAMQFVNSHMGHYPIPDKAPTVIFLNSDAKMWAQCGYGAYACTMNESGVIYFPASCAKELTLECKGALVHEISHYMDFKDGGFDESCSQSGEKEAYGNEDLYLKAYGSSLIEQGYTKEQLKKLTYCP